MSHHIFSPLQLSDKTKLKNRFVKAAMEENLADSDQLPDAKLFTLYEKWAKSGVALLITGNVMIDKLAMTGPGGVVLEKNTPIEPFKTWSSIAKKNNTKIWMQLNHPGRQVYKAMGGKNIAPSAIALNLGKHSSLFAQPQEMSEADIQDIITRFSESAFKAKQAGFDGVEIHAAHGYLLSQFLSPKTNQRQDNWGGSLTNRARLLIEVVKHTRISCGDDFDLAVKLNSADFQQGGFDIGDAEQVILLLAKHNVNIVELSGGSYEAPAMQGRTADERTLAREAYFLAFTKSLVKKSPIPLMLTGGIYRTEVAQQVINAGFSLCGLATTFAYQPNIINIWHTLPSYQINIKRVNWKNKTLASLATMALTKRQLRRLSEGKSPAFNDSALWSLISDQVKSKKRTQLYRKRMGLNLNT